MVWQLLKLDNDTRNLLNNPLPTEFIPLNSSVESPLLFSVDPTQFTHAYMLLGKCTNMFGYDLSLYLSTVNTYFSRSNNNKTIFISKASTDAKRRLSEDLGVAISSLFMVKAFDVKWETISQIPQNNKLYKKRPDFEGFTANGNRYLFESKGTTIAGNVEKMLGNAIEQVKEYPEDANSKLAIVSYFSADERLFDSATFVVDPPMPDLVPPDKDTSQLLHYERILQFAGMRNSATEYIKSLAKLLKETKESEYEQRSLIFEKSFGLTPSLVFDSINAEIERSKEKQIDEHIYFGQTLTEKINKKTYEIFMGVEHDILKNIQTFDIPRTEEIDHCYGDENRKISKFSNGTIMEITIY